MDKAGKRVMSHEGSDHYSDRGDEHIDKKIQPQRFTHLGEKPFQSDAIQEGLFSK